MIHLQTKFETWLMHLFFVNARNFVAEIWLFKIKKKIAFKSCFCTTKLATLMLYSTYTNFNSVCLIICYSMDSGFSTDFGPP